MGRSPCCDKVGLKKGPWTPEEDQKLLAYIEEHGHGSWRALPAKAGLQRCGKSCRLRWTNYLRPDIKRGKFSLQEEQTIIQLHALLGNRWSAIATHLPKRTDNEIKNYWNTHLKKRLAKMGIDPVTHKPKNDALLSTDGQSKNAANLSHMAQWESARLEAEARLVRESRLRSNSLILGSPGGFASASSPAPPHFLNKTAGDPPLIPGPSRSLDVLNAWHGGRGGGGNTSVPVTGIGIGGDLESPTSTLSFSENNAAPTATASIGESSMAVIDFVGNSGFCDPHQCGIIKEEGDDDHEDYKDFENSAATGRLPESLSFTSGIHDMAAMSLDGGAWTPESLRNSGANGQGHNASVGHFMEGFTDLLLNNSIDHQSSSDGGGSSGDSDNNNGGGGGGGGSGNGSSDDYEDNNNYWNNILNLVNSSPSDSPMF